MGKQFQRNLITADPDKAREGEVTAQVASAKVSLNRRSSVESRKFSSDRLCPYKRSSNQRKKERRGNG